MKDLIKKILKEETSDIKPSLIRAFYTFMEIETQDYNVYIDTPENRFEYNPESIWIINPDTKGWIIGFKRFGKLWYNTQLYENFLIWFKEDKSVFEQLITMWVEDFLRRKVSTIRMIYTDMNPDVEDVLITGIELQ